MTVEKVAERRIREKEEEESSLAIFSMAFSIAVKQLTGESIDFRYRLLSHDLLYLSMKLGIKLPSSMTEEELDEAWERVKEESIGRNNA